MINQYYNTICNYIQYFYLLQKIFLVIFNTNLVFVIIVENMSEESCTHQADNTSRPIKCCVVCYFSVLVNFNLYTNAYPALYLC